MVMMGSLDLEVSSLLIVVHMLHNSVECIIIGFVCWMATPVSDSSVYNHLTRVLIWYRSAW